MATNSPTRDEEPSFTALLLSMSPAPPPVNAPNSPWLSFATMHGPSLVSALGMGNEDNDPLPSQNGKEVGLTSELNSMGPMNTVSPLGLLIGESSRLGPMERPNFPNIKPLENGRIYMLEIQCGVDITKMLENFARAQKAGIKILSGMGRVRKMIVGNKLVPGSERCHGGYLDLVTVNGWVLGPAVLKKPELFFGSIIPSTSFYQKAQTVINVVCNGPHTGLIGGQVMGPFIAADTVVLNVTSFDDYEYHNVSQYEALRARKYGPVAGSGGGYVGDPLWNAMSSGPSNCNSGN